MSSQSNALKHLEGQGYDSKGRSDPSVWIHTYAFLARLSATKSFKSGCDERLAHKQGQTFYGPACLQNRDQSINERDPAPLL
jgi:hypothetical protein